MHLMATVLQGQMHRLMLSLMIVPLKGLKTACDNFGSSSATCPLSTVTKLSSAGLCILQGRRGFLRELQLRLFTYRTFIGYLVIFKGHKT